MYIMMEKHSLSTADKAYLSTMVSDKKIKSGLWVLRFSLRLLNAWVCKCPEIPYYDPRLVGVDGMQLGSFASPSCGLEVLVLAYG